MIPSPRWLFSPDAQPLRPPSKMLAKRRGQVGSHEYWYTNVFNKSFGLIEYDQSIS